MKQIFTLLFFALFFSHLSAQLTASNLQVSLDKENDRIYYAFNFEGSYYKVETSLYKNSITDENRIAYGIKEDESDYSPIIYPQGHTFVNFMTNSDPADFQVASQYIVVIKAWAVAGSGIDNYETKTLTTTLKEPIATNLKVTLNPTNQKIGYSFNFEGNYYKVETELYKNSISPSNRIASGTWDDDADYQPIHYPAGHIISTTMPNSNSSAYEPASQYLLVIKAREVAGIPIFLTKTLTYIPPQAIKPNFKIDGFVITEPFNNNKIIFDSYNSNQYPAPIKLVQSTKTYNFKVFVRKEGAVAANNVNLAFLQYDTMWGTYPNTSPASPQNKQINFGTNESVKTADFLSTIINFNGSQLISLGLAFHVDRSNAMPETNESDNYRFIHVQGHPAGTTFKSGNFGDIEGIINVDILDEKGKHIKTLTTSSDDNKLLNIKKQLKSGNYYFKTSNTTKRVKIDNK